MRNMDAGGVTLDKNVNGGTVIPATVPFPLTHKTLDSH